MVTPRDWCTLSACPHDWCGFSGHCSCNGVHMSKHCALALGIDSCSRLQGLKEVVEGTALAQLLEEACCGDQQLIHSVDKAFNTIGTT
jgi:hypothetical protein